MKIHFFTDMGETGTENLGHIKLLSKFRCGENRCGERNDLLSGGVHETLSAHFSSDSTQFGTGNVH